MHSKEESLVLPNLSLNAGSLLSRVVMVSHFLCFVVLLLLLLPFCFFSGSDEMCFFFWFVLEVEDL